MIWAPYSPCAVGCLTGDEERVPLATTVFRLIALCVAVLAVIPLAAVYPLLGAAERTAVARGWCRSLLRALDVRMIVDSPDEAPAGALVVSNHISWLDILAVGSIRPGRMVAKSDLRRWPLIGSLAARGGTIFVDRNRLSTLPGTVADVRAALLAGARVVAWPEGTTRCGVETGRFYPAVFQAAIDAGAPVEPVTVGYSAAGRPTTVTAFLGDDPLTASVWRIARARGVAVAVRCHPVLPPGRNRRMLAAAAASISVLAPRVDRLVGVHSGQVVNSHPA
ncbi:lysophospholipid acyltransferase family protein [Cryptosporangium sp. NPDC048952]|uniref:lysophospholipid acyltransferase family protein n=1 Tax=Cryptosporangium sp. NPDC048952 TaxID=3363961 RepID=UPI00371F7B08